jgi:hypothetical protein
MLRALRLGLFLASTFLAAGCGAASAGGGELRVLVDDELRLTLGPADVDAPVDLFEALGIEPAEVLWVAVRGPAEEELKVKAPAERYPKRILAAFGSEAGIGAGWVDAALGKLPERLAGPPPVSLADAVEVRVRVTRDERAGPPEAAPKLRLETSRGEVLELVPEDVARLPRRTPKEVLGLGQGQQKLAMAFLGDLVLERWPAEAIEAVVLHPAEAGEARSFDAAALSIPASRAVLFKLNNKGHWRFKIYDAVEGEARSAADLRGLERLEIRLR